MKLCVGGKDQRSRVSLSFYRTGFPRFFFVSRSATFCKSLTNTFWYSALWHACFSAKGCCILDALLFFKGLLSVFTHDNRFFGVLSFPFPLHSAFPPPSPPSLSQESWYAHAQKWKSEKKTFRDALVNRNTCRVAASWRGRGRKIYSNTSPLQGAHHKLERKGDSVGGFITTL